MIASKHGPYINDFQSLFRPETDYSIQIFVLKPHSISETLTVAKTEPKGTFAYILLLFFSFHTLTQSFFFLEYEKNQRPIIHDSFQNVYGVWTKYKGSILDFSEEGKQL